MGAQRRQDYPRAYLQKVKLHREHPAGSLTSKARAYTCNDLKLLLAFLLLLSLHLSFYFLDERKLALVLRPVGDSAWLEFFHFLLALVDQPSIVVLSNAREELGHPQDTLVAYNVDISAHRTVAVPGRVLAGWGKQVLQSKKRQTVFASLV
jgi:hypothetical protein